MLQAAVAQATVSVFTACHAKVNLGLGILSAGSVDPEILTNIGPIPVLSIKINSHAFINKTKFSSDNTKKVHIYWVFN